MILGRDKKIHGPRKEARMNLVIDGILKLSTLVKALGKLPVERTERTVGDRTFSQIVWEGSDLQKILSLPWGEIESMSEPLKIDGPMPGWFAGWFAVTFPFIELNSSDGFIPIQMLEFSSSGEGAGVLEWTTRNLEATDWTILEFALTAPAISARCLSDLYLPEIPQGAPVIVSGRGPIWLTASVAKSLGEFGHTVAVYQPGTGSTVVCLADNDSGLSVGDVIPDNF